MPPSEPDLFDLLTEDETDVAPASPVAAAPVAPAAPVVDRSSSREDPSYNAKTNHLCDAPGCRAFGCFGLGPPRWSVFRWYCPAHRPSPVEEPVL